MALNNLTITGKIGPGTTITSLLFSNVQVIDFDFVKQVITVTYLTAGGDKKIQTFDLAVEATVTYTIASGVATITIST